MRLAAARWARNLELAEMNDELAEGDELAVLPPVAGGTTRARLGHDPLDVAEILAAVSSPNAGATVLFVGTVRAESGGRVVERLEYEAYEPMALRQAEQIAVGTMARHPGTEVALSHRVGSLNVGEIAVVVGASAPHRAEAFAACREAIEGLKGDVPIWKREVGPDGASWIGWP